MQEINTIYNEDCLQNMERVSKLDLIDIVLTSPPYNMTERKGGESDSGRYDVYEDWMSEEEYISWTIRLFEGFGNILKPNRSVIYNFSYSIENPALPYKLVSAIEQNTEFCLIDTVMWKKKCGLPFPANSKRLSRNWEFVWVFVRKSEKDSYENNRKVKSVSDKTGQNYYDVVYNYIEADNNDGKCPYNQATYSTELCTQLLDIYCKDGWVVYDPFMGSGTTAISCVRRGLGYVGSELSENQIKFAQDRLDKEKEKIFISNNIESLF